MAGHIGGLGYSVRHDVNGNPLVGWTLTVYESGTSTPASVFQDYSLSIAHTNPIIADANGMMPMFWVDDGTYRVRGLDPSGNELFDDDGVVALGPSSGTGGGGSVSVDENALLQTGDFFWRGTSGTRSGAVRANGRTIGSAASGATERANADAEDLFLHLWNNYSNSICAVTGGRGGSAAADWAANKVIATVNMRSKTAMGLDDMGNTAAGVTGGSTVPGGAVGASTYTIAQGNLPNISFSSTSLSVSVATTFNLTVDRTINNGDFVARTTQLLLVDNGSGVGRRALVDNAFSTISTLTLASSLVSGTAASSASISGSMSLGGSGTDIDILSPAVVGTWYIKL